MSLMRGVIAACLLAVLAALAAPATASCGEPEVLGDRLVAVDSAGLEVIGAVEHRVAAVSFQLPALGRTWASSISRTWGDVSPPFEFEARIAPVEADHGRSPCGGFPSVGDSHYTLVARDADGVRSLWVGGRGSPGDVARLEALLGESTLVAEGHGVAVLWHAWWRTGLLVAGACFLAVTVTRRRERVRSTQEGV